MVFPEQFPINTSSQISGINKNYNRNDYLIQMNGKLYVLVAIQEDAYTGNLEDIVDTPTESTEEESKKSLSWLFYLLGGIGVLGGGFLIMRLRRRVRAA